MSIQESKSIFSIGLGLDYGLLHVAHPFAHAKRAGSDDPTYRPLLYARYLCPRDELGLKAKQPAGQWSSSARDDRVYYCALKGDAACIKLWLGLLM